MMHSGANEAGKRMTTTDGQQPREFCEIANGRRIHGLHWQSDPGGLPTLALHGWLDNAASFSPLGARLSGLDVWAIDLPGHGLSDHRPAPGSYNLWDDLLDILAFADALGWERFNLLGHSRGALISTLLAATMPERMGRMVLLDAVWPKPVPAAQAPAVLRKYLVDQRRCADKKLPRYSDIAEAIVARQKATGLSAAIASLLVARGVAVSADGSVTWRSDPRLTLGSAFKLSREHSEAFFQAITAPTLILLAEDGYARIEGVQQLLKRFAKFESHILPGGHHFHAEDPDLLAPLVSGFLTAS
jgi:pimeloyl-ACP methyl ester carboxylesterase